MNDEKLFKQFLEEYLENVKKILPTSYRSLQLKKGGIEAKLVIEFETRFLKGAFIEIYGKVVKEARENEKEKHNQQIREIIEAVQKMPNRDDYIQRILGQELAIGILDGGGVKRFDVIKLLENYLEHFKEGKK